MSIDSPTTFITVKALAAIKAALSPARIATFEKAMNVFDTQDAASIELYAWNAAISSAMLIPLHVCEVTIRNAVAEALTALYGPQWPWSKTFELSLPDAAIGYSARKDLFSARQGVEITDQVIPKLKFIFWQKMFTSRYDERIWNGQLQKILPNINLTLTTKVNRLTVYQNLDLLRKLRNRIAHHEPIFMRDLKIDYEKIFTLVNYRCTYTASWVSETQTITSLLMTQPLPK